MRYQTSTKEEVLTLRKKGLSLLEISGQTKIPLATIALWTKDISLSQEQKNYLYKRGQVALQNGRRESQLIKQKKQAVILQNEYQKGLRQIQELTNKDYFYAGIALYWGEGFKNKYEHRLGFCNSDVGMLLFYIRWLEKYCMITKDRLVLRLSINNSYKKRDKEIKQYWSEALGISLEQFTKTFYQQTKWKKEYSNSDYYGVVRIHVKDSLLLLWKMKGWLEGLKMLK